MTGSQEIFELAKGLMVAEQGGKSDYLKGRPYDLCDAEPQKNSIASGFIEKIKSATVER